MSDRPDWAEAMQAAILGEISGLRDDLGKFRAEVGKISADLNKTRTEIMERIDRLQEELTCQREDDVVNFGAAERAERIAKGPGHAPNRPRCGRSASR